MSYLLAGKVNDHGVWFRWVTGGTLALAAALFLSLLQGQDARNKEQDASIKVIQQQNNEAFSALSAQNAATALILEGVARKLEAIDERGSQALRTHERGHN